MGYGETFEGFCDCFYYGVFDPSQADALPGKTTVYFLHGALHLIVTGAGEPRKLNRLPAKTLLDQFGQPPPDDPHARPLLITEGTHQDKQVAIDGNPYLAHSLARLRETSDPLVIFGHGFGDQDEHLVEAINAHPDRAVAVSVRPSGGRNKVRQRQSSVRGKLVTEELYFFNSRSHPLGSKSLTHRASWYDLRRLPSRVASGIARPS